MATTGSHLPAQASYTLIRADPEVDERELLCLGLQAGAKKWTAHQAFNLSRPLAGPQAVLAWHESDLHIKLTVQEIVSYPPGCGHGMLLICALDTAAKRQLSAEVLRRKGFTSGGF